VRSQFRHDVIANGIASNPVSFIQPTGLPAGAQTPADAVSGGPTGGGSPSSGRGLQPDVASSARTDAQTPPRVIHSTNLGTTPANQATPAQGSAPAATPFVFLGGSNGNVVPTSPAPGATSSSSTPNGLSAFSASLSSIPHPHGASVSSDGGMDLMAHDGHQAETASNLEALDAVYASQSFHPPL
jgi:hypothetical protein